MSTIPVIPLVRHAAPADWTPAQRAELAKRLAAVGTTITELSDARERLGFPRLSESSDWDREHAHDNLESIEIQTILVAIRHERWELEQAIGRRDRKVVTQARKLLKLRSGFDLRLAELYALRDQAGIIEILAEVGTKPAPVVERHDGYTEAELFGG